MRHVNPNYFVNSRGFTLIESIIVLILLGIASIGIISLQGNIFSGQGVNKNLIVSAQLMQECAEQILATRRTGGFNAAPLADSAAATGSCSGITLAGYSAPAVTITAGNSTTIIGGVLVMLACPYATGSNCKLVSIAQGGLTPVTLLLVGP